MDGLDEALRGPRRKSLRPAGLEPATCGLAEVAQLEAWAVVIPGEFAGRGQKSSLQ